MGRVLVGCEFSGTVRRAFESLGHEAWSCDLLEAEDGGGRFGRHIVGDVVQVVRERGGWDLAIFHPPCTRLAASGARWMAGRQDEIEEALDLVRWLMAYQRHVPKVCIENPIGVISTRVREPDQIIQPWQFGHGETKATCLWLRCLPELRYTRKVAGREQRLYNLAPGANRWAERSRTFQGVAEAMAQQWGKLI